MCRLIMLLKGEANELSDKKNSYISGPEGMSISISTATPIKHLSAKICGGSIATFEFNRELNERPF